MFVQYAGAGEIAAGRRGIPAALRPRPLRSRADFDGLPGRQSRQERAGASATGRGSALASSVRPRLPAWIGDEFKFLGWERCERAWCCRNGTARRCRNSPAVMLRTPGILATHANSGRGNSEAHTSYSLRFHRVRCQRLRGSPCRGHRCEASRIFSRTRVCTSECP
jgi:hypothetical protein